MPLKTGYTDLDTGIYGVGEVFLPEEKMHTKVGVGMRDITPSEDVNIILERILARNLKK